MDKLASILQLFQALPVEYEQMYLMRLVPRKDLFSFCKKDDLPALLYFILQLYSKRHAFVFQKLE